MSVEAMAWALQTPLAGTPKILMIGLANHATAEFDNARPSVSTLASYAHCSERSVQRALRQLEADGWIEKTGIHPVANRADRAVNVYRICQERGDVGVAPLPNGVTSMTPRGDAGVANGVTLVSPEPSIEPSKNRPSPPVGRPPDQLVEDEDDQRAKGFVQWFKAELTQRRGGVAPHVDGDWQKAARKVVRGRSGDELRAVVVWGLDSGWWYSRIRTLPLLQNRYPDLRAEWLARSKKNGSNGHAPDRLPPRSVRYDSERVEIIR